MQAHPTTTRHHAARIEPNRIALARIALARIALARLAPKRLAALLTLLMLSCTSCFTMTVWGFDVEESPDIVTGEPETVMVYDPETEWSWKLFGLRILATPFALVLDCATAPLQAIFLWNDDDEHDRRDDRR